MSKLVTEFHNEGYMPAGRFEQFSGTDEYSRQYLEAIVKFRQAQEEGIVAEDGFKLPDIGCLPVTHVTDIIFVPDDLPPLNSLFKGDIRGWAEGWIMVKPVAEDVQLGATPKITELGMRTTSRPYAA